MKTDSLFYRLFQRIPSLLLELAGLDVAADGYRFHAVEVKQTAFRLDGVLLPPESDTLCGLAFFPKCSSSRTGTSIRVL